MIYKIVQMLLAALTYVVVPAGCIWAIVNALRTGVVNSHGILYSRAQHPIAYWIAIGTWGFVAIAVPSLLTWLVIRKLH